MRKKLDKADQAKVLMLEDGRVRVKIGQPESRTGFLLQWNCPAGILLQAKIMLEKAYMMRLYVLIGGKSNTTRNAIELLTIETPNDNFAVLEPFVLTTNVRTMTEQEKYKKAFKTLQAVAEQMSHYGTEDFLANMEALKKLQTQLMLGKNYLKIARGGVTFWVFI